NSTQRRRCTVRAAEQKTILPQEWSCEMPTLPALDQGRTPSNEAQPGEQPGKAGDVIGTYRIHSLFQQRRESTLYIASSEEYPRCILKVHDRQERREYAAAYQRLKNVPKDFITLLDWGVQDGKVYECLEKVDGQPLQADRKSTRLNSSHVSISYAVFCLKKKN